MTVNTKDFAKKLLRLTKKHTPMSTYPVPVGKLRAMCSEFLEEKPDKEMPPLTDVEQSVLSALKADVAQGINPTIRSAADRLGYKQHSSAQGAVNRLIKHGYLKRHGSKKQIVVVNLQK